MTATFTRTDRYDADPATVFAMVTDERFLAEKYTSLGMQDVEVLQSAAAADGSHVVRTRRAVPTAGVPDLARRFVGERQVVVETDTWGPPQADGSRRGSWTVESPGAPMGMRGELALEADGAGGTTVRIDGEVKASVPLIGGKLEKALTQAVEHNLEGEARFGERWLAGR